MATFPALSPEIRQSIARQIGERLPRSAGPAAPASRPLLGESLPIVLLPANLISPQNLPLRKIVVSTNQWHHQVYLGNNAYRFARSKGTANMQTVGELVSSPLPAELAQSLKIVDEILPGNATASLLVVPAFYLTALLLESAASEQVIIVERPNRLSMLELNIPYSAAQFLGLLSTVAPSGGVPNIPQGTPPAFL
jgi:hypothetical protein